MGTLEYIGRYPDTDFTLVHKRYADAQYAAVKVDTGYVNSCVATEVVPLTSTGYVDAEDNLKDHVADVTATDANYIPLTQLGVANGVAQLGSDVYVPAANLPPLTTERRPFIVNGSGFFSGTHEVISLNAKEFQAGSLTITDPGFPYIPVFTAVIQGGSVNGNQPSRMLGTGSYGQVSILRSDGLKYGWCICTAQKTLDFFTVLPFADTTINPTVLPPLYGTTNWALWLGLWSGTTYSYTSTGMQFYATIWPGF
jgi:hypothetical protein